MSATRGLAMKRDKRYPDVPPFRLDVRSRTVAINERVVHLTHLEFAVLYALMENAPGLVSYARLLDTIWGSHATEKRNYLRLYVHYLRSKLEDDPSHPMLILNERRKGYRLALPA
ncbi:MAG: winged helix-turn-helix domain-containing protein [Chloroflexota bacterium]